MQSSKSARGQENALAPQSVANNLSPKEAISDQCTSAIQGRPLPEQRQLILKGITYYETTILKPMLDEKDAAIKKITAEKDQINKAFTMVSIKRRSPSVPAGCASAQKAACQAFSFVAVGTWLSASS